MVRERDGIAGQVLVELGADLPRTRETVVALVHELGPARERLRAGALAGADGIDPATEEASTGPDADLIDWDDPAALGAAPTLSGGRARTSQRAAARSSRVSARASGTDDEPASPEHGQVDADGTVVSVFEAGKSVRPELRPYLESLWERRPFMVALGKARSAAAGRARCSGASGA